MRNQRKPWKMALWVAAGVAALATSCLLGVVLANINSPNTATTKEPLPDPVGKAETPSTAAAEKSSPRPAATIAGDDIVEVGTDVPAGTYRVAEAVNGLCYWKKSRDPEGSNIIANGIPAGGRPQVTLKAGQWFTSSRCPDWVKK